MTLPVYYVYSHVDPIRNSIVYIGHGKYDRAWTTRTTTRSQKGHYQYLIELGTKGYIPEDWVYIISKNLTKNMAKELEQKLIKEHKPIFNVHQGIGSVRRTYKSDLIEKVKELKDNKLSYSQIAKELGFKSGMTAWRYANE